MDSKLVPILKLMTRDKRLDKAGYRTVINNDPGGCRQSPIFTFISSSEGNPLAAGVESGHGDRLLRSV